MSDSSDGQPTIKWVNVSAEEARAIAPQSEFFNDAKRQSERTSQAVDAALSGPKWSDAAPAGVDPRAYIAAMAGKADGNFVPEHRDGFKATLPLGAPTSLSIKTPWGASRPPGDAKPGDLLTIHISGQPVDLEIEQAVREGLVRRSAGGGYQPLPEEELRALQAEALRDMQKQKPIEGGALDAKRATGDEPDADTSALIGAINARVPAPAIDALANDMLTNGSLSMENVVRVGQASGLSAEQAMTYASRAVEGFQRQANAAAISVGVAAEELGDVHAWASQQMPLEYNNAQRALAFASDARGMKDIARKYRAAQRERRG